MDAPAECSPGCVTHAHGAAARDEHAQRPSHPGSPHLLTSVLMFDGCAHACPIIMHSCGARSKRVAAVNRLGNEIGARPSLADEIQILLRLLELSDVPGPAAAAAALHICIKDAASVRRSVFYMIASQLLTSSALMCPRMVLNGSCCTLAGCAWPDANGLDNWAGVIYPCAVLFAGVRAAGCVAWHSCWATQCRP